LEDSLWIGRGELATSNASQVHRARQIVEGLGFEVATPTEAREALSLKGGDKSPFTSNTLASLLSEGTIF